LVMRPLLPASSNIDRVREKGGEMTGSWAIAERNFLPRVLVLCMTNANRNPTSVDVVAVKNPRRMEPHSACRLLPDKELAQIDRENLLSTMNDSLNASASGNTMNTIAIAERTNTEYPTMESRAKRVTPDSAAKSMNAPAANMIRSRSSLEPEVSGAMNTAMPSSSLCASSVIGA